MFQDLSHEDTDVAAAESSNAAVPNPELHILELAWAQAVSRTRTGSPPVPMT